MSDSVLHIEYEIHASKIAGTPAPTPDGACYDHADFKVHTKDELDKVVGFLRGMGFQVKAGRTSHNTLIDEPFPGEDP